MENSVEIPQKIKNRIATGTSSFTPGYISKEKKKHEFKKGICTPLFTATLFIIIVNMEATCVPTER